MSLIDDIQKESHRGREYQDYEFPKVSIVLPTYNNSEKLDLTIDRILFQEYPDFELIIVDAGSTDRTLEVIHNYRDERIRVCTVSKYNRYEMLNKGISQASGTYVNIVFPGDFYIHQRTLDQLMRAALDNDKPDLVYCGTFLRDGRSEPKILMRQLTMKLLSRGQQPTSLQSCWFKTETIKALGKFDTSYTLRGSYEIICRLAKKPVLRVVSINRVLIDYDLRYVTLEMVAAHFRETFKTIHRYFGIILAIRWLFIQKDFRRLIKLWFRGIRTAFLGR